MIGDGASVVPADHPTSRAPAAEACDFCLRLNGSMDDRPWYDFNVLHRTGRFQIVVALGALVPGHLMIVSDAHAERMADLTHESILELEALIDEWGKRLARQWNAPCFMFEHAGKTRNGDRAGCVAHAHLQLLPVFFQPTRDETYRQTMSLRGAFRSVGQRDYLLVSCDAGWAVTTKHQGTGQYLRRKISVALGAPDEWDYLVYPRHDLMDETIRRLTPAAPAALPLGEKQVRQAS